MLDPELLKILADPLTKEPLRQATAAEVAKVNAAISRGVKNAGGQPVTLQITDGLVPTQSGKRLYPVRDGIPLVLQQESVPLE